MQISNFIYLIALTQATQVGTDSCSGGSFTTETSCDQTGYCYWEGSCNSKPCYLIDEIASCRTTSSWNGVLNSQCKAVDDKQFKIQYDNVCYKISEYYSNYAFIRFPMDKEGYADAAADTTPLTTLTSSITLENMKKLFTVNLNKATSITQVASILQAYKDYASLLITSKESHPFYIEKVSYQALQYIRDYYYLKTDSMPPKTEADANSVLGHFGGLFSILMKRIFTFSPNYYQSNYNFIVYAAIPMNRLRLVVNGQLHTITVKIESSDYHTQGFIQIMSYPADQFGYKSLSNIIFASFLDSSYNPIASQQFSLTWQWSDPALSVVTSNVQLFSFRHTGPVLISPSVSCSSATKQCTSGILTVQDTYFFSYPLGGCATLDEVYCRLRIGCTWTTSCN